jgi:hypothetical protein
VASRVYTANATVSPVFNVPSAALEEMISKYNTEVGKVLGLDLRIGMGEFIRALIKQHAIATGQVWPDDYPAPRGRRTRN